MKIIGKANNGFILEANTDEIANLMGMYSRYSAGYKDQKPHVGDEINIKGLYNKYAALKSLRKRCQEIRFSAERIFEAIDDLEPFTPISDQQLKRKMNPLTETEKYIICNLHGLFDNPKKNYAEVGLDLNMSEATVKEIETFILDKMMWDGNVEGIIDGE